MRRLILISIVFLLLANVADLWTSAVTPEFPEQNNFARDANFKFVLSHAIELKAITMIALLVVASVLFLALYKLSQELAASAFAGFLFYWGIDVFLNGAFYNFLLYLDKYLHWFVPSFILLKIPLIGY